MTTSIYDFVLISSKFKESIIGLQNQMMTQTHCLIAAAVIL